MRQSPLQPAHIGLAIAAVVFLADRATKFWVLDVLDLPARGDIPVFSFFDLTMVWNYGISMGLFQANSETGRWVLIVLTSVIALGLVVWLFRVNQKPMAIAIGCIVGGAIGNIWDRIAFGAVADFLHFSAYGWSFYVFNIADAMITLGVLLLLADGLLFAKKPPNYGDN